MHASKCNIVAPSSSENFHDDLIMISNMAILGIVFQP